MLGKSVIVVGFVLMFMLVCWMIGLLFLGNLVGCFKMYFIFMLGMVIVSIVCFMLFLVFIYLFVFLIYVVVGVFGLGMGIIMFIFMLVI